MRLVIEPGDFPAESGKKVEELADPVYGFSVDIVKQPGRGPFARIKHRGGGHRIDAPQFVIEIAGQVLDATDVLGTPVDRPAGPSLQDTSDWYESD